VGSAPAQNARGKQTDHHHPTNPQATPDSRAGLFIQQRLQSRIELLLSQDSLHTLIPFLIIWGAGILSLFIVAVQPSKGVRIAWATLISISTFASTAYMQIIGGAILTV
jgi:hypothetical protein